MMRLLLPVVCLLALAACQNRNAGPLPAPSFDGPRVLASQKPIYIAPPPPVGRDRTVRPPPAQGSFPVAWKPAATERKWLWIVLHHSATATGGAVAFDKMHRAKGWDELGYHFVIGNGTDTGDGLVEVGSRWPPQKWGAHAKTADNRFNEQGIGICLVGNFENSTPTAKQVESTVKLVAHLMARYNIPADRVLGHRDCKPTDCPGARFPMALVKQRAAALAKTLTPSR